MKLDLNTIIEYFNGLNDQIRYGILGGVVFVIFVLDIVFLALPQWGGIADINGQIKKLTEDTQQVLVERQRIGLLKKGLEESRLQFKSLNDKVRPIQEVPVILETIANVANDNNVKIDQLVPDKVHQVLLKQSSDTKYYSLPVKIKARCGYHMFGRFLNKLEGEDMYFIIKDFIIQNDDKDVHVHQFSLTVQLILADHTTSSPKSL